MWLAKQWHDYEKLGGFRLLPTDLSYTAVMKAWSSVGEPEIANDLLYDCMQRNETINSKQLEPSTQMFSSVINAWLRSANSRTVLNDNKR